MCGYFNPPSLFDRCADALAAAMDLSELEAALPASVAARVRHAYHPRANAEPADEPSLQP